MSHAIPRYCPRRRRTVIGRSGRRMPNRRANRRYVRTVALGVLGLAALVWVAMDQFGISRQEMSDLFLWTVLVISVVIVVAALAVLVWMGLRKIARRRR